LVISSIVDGESFQKQCTQLDSATRDYLATRLDYYQVDIAIGRQYRADSSFTVTSCLANITVTKTFSTTSNSGLIWDVSIHKYTVTVNTSEYMHIPIGFAPSKLFDVSQSNWDSCGWYLHLGYGYLFSQNGDHPKVYSGGCKVGDSITCIYNSSSSEISFEQNGVSLGVAFTNVKGKDMAPAVQLFSLGDSITLSID
jgi:SPRY domain